MESYIAPGVKLTPPPQDTTTTEEFLAGRFGLKLEDLPARSKMFIKRLEEYVVGMGPKTAKNPSTIAALQKTYLDTMLGILSSDKADAIRDWEILLFFANKYHYTIFNDRVLNQYYNKLPTDRQVVFTLLNTLIIGTSSVGTRRAFLRKFQITAVLEKLPKLEQRENLAMYYATSLSAG